MANVKFLFLYDDGLENVIKRSHIANYLKSGKAQVICLQETHQERGGILVKTRGSFYGTIYHSEVSKIRGVLIAIAHSVL